MNHTHKCPMCGCIHITPRFDGDESQEQTCMSCKGRFVIGTKRDGDHWETKIAPSMERREA